MRAGEGMIVLVVQEEEQSAGVETGEGTGVRGVVGESQEPEHES